MSGSGDKAGKDKVSTRTKEYWRQQANVLLIRGPPFDERELKHISRGFGSKVAASARELNEARERGRQELLEEAKKAPSVQQMEVPEEGDVTDGEEEQADLTEKPGTEHIHGILKKAQSTGAFSHQMKDKLVSAMFEAVEAGTLPYKTMGHILSTWDNLAKDHRRLSSAEKDDGSEVDPHLRIPERELCQSHALQQLCLNDNLTWSDLHILEDTSGLTLVTEELLSRASKKTLSVTCSRVLSLLKQHILNPLEQWRRDPHFRDLRALCARMETRCWNAFQPKRPHPSIPVPAELSGRTPTEDFRTMIRQLAFSALQADSFTSRRVMRLVVEKRREIFRPGLDASQALDNMVANLSGEGRDEESIRNQLEEVFHEGVFQERLVRV